MNRKSYFSVSAIVFSTLIFSTLTLLTSCSSSSSSTTTPPPPVVAIAATSGGGQSAAVGAQFTNPLAATVTTSGTPTSGATVTFTAPGSGASGTFGTPTPGVTDTETTNSSGVATSQLFTANATAGTYTVTASVSGASTAASFSLTNNPATVSPLAAGNYVYNVSGEDNNPLGIGPYFLAGVFTVSASGAITGGEQSFSDDFVYVQDTISTTGSSVVAGNNGNVVITLNTGDAGIGVAGVETLNVSMVSTSNGLLTEYDTWASGSGTLDLQTSTAAPSGGYAFFNTGVDLSGLAVVIGGVINVDSAGNISGNGSVFDENDGGTLSADQPFAASTVTGPDSLGQVVFDLTPKNSGSTLAEFEMVGYIVDADHIRWVENWNVDGLGANAGGTALGQGPNVGTYGTGSLSGSSGVFGATGFDANGPLQTAGLLSFNLDGSVTGNVSFNDFVALTPQGGTALAAETTPCSPGPAVTACYAVDSTGRVTITNVTDSTATPTFNYNFQLYLARDGGTVISMDANDALSGLGYPQTGAGAFTASSFTGNYVLNVTQQDTNTTKAFEYDGIGTITATGSSNSFTGFLDLNGTPGNPGTPLTPTPGTAGGVTGTFPTANATGVFTGTITGIDTVNAATADNFTFYLIGATSGPSVGVIGIENDANPNGQLTLATFELIQ